MRHFRIFTDGSVNVQTKVGYGAYFVACDLSPSLDSLKELVKVRRFQQTSSTKLELQTLLWALSEVFPMAHEKDICVTIYTDCQSIVSLPSRRARLEASDYFSRKNKRLNNYELYKEFYRMTTELKCEFVKVAGHKPTTNKDDIDRLFALVDLASRRALRAD